MEASIISAIIASSTSIISLVLFKPIIDGYLMKYHIKITYKAEQSKKVKDHIAKHKNLLLQSAENLHERIKNFSKNHTENWLSVNGDYSNEHYYLDSTVYRFLNFFAQIKSTEKDLIYIDSTNAQKRDLRMLKYFKLFQILMCDVDIFEGFQYDKNNATDHFFSTSFYNLSNILKIDSGIMDFDQFISEKGNLLSRINEVYFFFDGLNPNENRLRCERLKIFHIALICFLNEYGYDYQKTNIEKIQYLKNQLGDYKLLKNFSLAIKKVKLNKFFFDPIKRTTDILEKD